MRISTSQIFQRALDSLLAQQTRASKLQDQLASGLKVQSPSDDPIASAQIELMSQRINYTESLQKNRQAVESALTLEESVLSDMVSTLHRLREIQVQAGNSAMSQEDRRSLGLEAKSLLNQLQDNANTKDSFGHYMFSGSKTTTPPISINSSGQYIYNGDNTQRFQAVTGTLQVANNDTGDNLFMRILNGNGRFAVTTPTPNAGTAHSSTGAVVNDAAYVADDYTLSFATNTQGKLVVMVVGAASGNVIPSSGLPDDAPLYQEGQAISFNGMELTISGEPSAGDSFVTKPSQNESLFSTVQRMIDNLNKPFNTSVAKAATLTENNQILSQIDAAQITILSYQSNIGTRLNQLESAEKANVNLIDTSKEVLKQLQEADPVAIASMFNQQLVTLQAAQQSFARIQQLSIFNYI